jgi:hypothetical protein
MGKKRYYWSTDNGVLFHTGVGDERVNPFFDTVDEAEDFLQKRADMNGQNKYSGATLRVAGGEKVMEATNVLTSQAGIGQFAAGD